ncbi:MAG TPA: hypothetical protein VFU04_09670 [Solirubrobacterales bacterium]|nr:hypothetical protein [Solirubrobacterales bacterium]
MREGIWRQSPALVVAGIALFVAMGGTVYAAKQAKLNGKAIKAKSLPGNRLALRSVPANRLKPGVLKDAVAGPAGPLTGADINELTLGLVPNAGHAQEADFAQSAGDAQTALDAVDAINAQKINGYGAGCKPGTRLFAGACWQASPSQAALTAPQAAAECATQGGALPDALALAAFAKQPGVILHEGGEWSGDVTNVSGLDVFGVVTASPAGGVDSALSTATRRYRCVIPLVS